MAIHVTDSTALVQPMIGEKLKFLGYHMINGRSCLVNELITVTGLPAHESPAHQ